MLKKLSFLILLTLLLRLPGLAQTVVWNESFSDAPTDWTMDGNWVFDNGAMLFYYYPVFENFDFSAISPEVQIPDFSSTLTLTQFIDPYLNGVTNEMCEIWVIAEDEEVMVFSYEIINGTWGDMGGSTFSHSLEQFTGQKVRFKFRSHGATTNSLWNWTLFDVSVATNYSNELCAMEVSGPSNVLPGAGGTWQFSFKNAGTFPQTDFMVRLFSFKTGEQLDAVPFSGTVNAGETAVVDLNWVPEDYQNNSIYGVIDSQVDEFPANNRSKGYFVRVEPPVDYTVLVWDNDNGIETIYNPETGTKQQSNKFIESALSLAGISYDIVYNLPDNLDDYNLVLCTMGSYCLS